MEKEESHLGIGEMIWKMFKSHGGVYREGY